MSEEASFLTRFGYHLDESDPDLLVLRRKDGSFVAAFSPGGATKAGIVEAAKRDRAALVRANSPQPAFAEKDPRGDLPASAARPS